LPPDGALRPDDQPLANMPDASADHLSPPNRSGLFGPRVRGKLAELFGADVRSLAAFRVAVGLILLLDLWGRGRELTAFYTDAGILPRDAWIELVQARGDTSPFWSLQLLSGEAWAQGVLLLINALAATCLLIGYRTRLATIACAVLLYSLQIRNPLINDGGDSLLMCLLFWSIFVPLGAAASVDRLVRGVAGPARRQVASLGTTALLLQMGLMYWFSAALKSDPIWHTEGSAVYYVMQADLFATRLGIWLRDFPVVMTALTFATWWLEWLGPAVAFSPFWTARLRMAAVLAFWTFHLGLVATMELGLFPWICMAGWLPFVPGTVWDALGRRLQGRATQATLWYDAGQSRAAVAARTLAAVLGPGGPRVEAALPASPAADALRRDGAWLAVEIQDKWLTGPAAVATLARLAHRLWAPAWPLRGRALRSAGGAVAAWLDRRHRTGRYVPLANPEQPRLRSGWLANGLAGVLLVYVILWNIRTLRHEALEKAALPPEWNFVGESLGLGQWWTMFAPRPMTRDGWYVMRGVLDDGSEVNLWSPDEPLSLDKPELVSKAYRSQRWRKYLLNLLDQDNAVFRLFFSNWLHDRWQREVGDPTGRKLVTVEIIYQEEYTPPPGETIPLPDPIVLWVWQYR
jgi:hypothetical protein